jgi:hypothetical protein
MRTSTALATGFARARSSAALVAFLWLTSLVAALPATLVVREAVKRSVGESRVHLDLEARFDLDWYSEYEHEAVGVEGLLTPTSVRPAAVLDNLEAWLSGDLFTTHPALVALGVAFALGWTLVAGGVLHRFAYYETAFSLPRLLGHGAELLPRFLRLLALTAALYYGVYRLGRWLFPWIEERLRDVTVERVALAAHLAGAALVALLLLVVKLISDYAKVATVLERRHGMLRTAWRALRFVARHPVRTLGAYVVVALGTLAALGLVALLAPGQGQASVPAVAWAFLCGQAMIVARVLGRLTAWGVAVEIYRDDTA